jgi:pyruvate dehydrogenase phosphatase
LLKKELLTLVQRNLRELQPQLRNEDTIQLAIEKAFIDLDDSIINNYVNSAQNNGIALEEKIRYMQLAMSGSCALLSLYDPMTNTLYTACTGDSRATLGAQNSDGTWVPVELSKDQKG